MKRPVLDACRHFMRPIVRFLLRNGVTFSEFQELGRSVYVEVARADYGLQGRPTNNARVAMLTGLSRREVARVRKELEGTDDAAAPAQTSKSRITEILTGWHTDPDFVAEDGEPRSLETDDDAAGFPALLKRYGGDMPHIALTKEMLQVKVMEQTADGAYRVLARDYVHGSLSPDLVAYMGNSLHDHAATLEHNLNPERKKPARFERRATNLHVSARAARRFYEMVEERGLALLEDIDAWLARHEVNAETNARDHGVRMGVGIYLFHDNLRKGRSE